MLIAALSIALLWLITVYSQGLRDPRYMDGWILAAGMGVQVSYHLARKSGVLSPRSASRWRAVHIFLGYLLIALFLSHSDFSLPDTVLEWALWTSFVLVAASGVFGMYLSWINRSRVGMEDLTSMERIAARREALRRDVEAAVAAPDPSAAAIALPSAAYNDWIVDFHRNRLRDFFAGPRNASAHLIGSQNHLKALMAELDELSHYLDPVHQSKLAYIRSLVVEKDRLDYAAVCQGLTRGWLLVHVPVTYSLAVLTVLHVIVVYAFSSGAS